MHIVSTWIVARKWYQAIDEYELGIRFGHLSKSSEYSYSVKVRPIVHNLLEEKDGSILDWLRLEEIVSFESEC